jgi:hypothetical protein
MAEWPQAGLTGPLTTAIMALPDRIRHWGIAQLAKRQRRNSFYIYKLNQKTTGRHGPREHVVWQLLKSWLVERFAREVN